MATFKFPSLWLQQRAPLLALTLSLGVTLPGCGPSSEDPEEDESSNEEKGSGKSEKSEEDQDETTGEEGETGSKGSGKKKSEKEEDSSGEPDDTSDVEEEKTSEEELPEPKDEFEDAALKACVKEAAGSLSEKDLAKLEVLDCHGRGIESLGGMGQLRGLKHLTLFENKIKDIGALGHLTSLESLALGSNQIASLTALKTLDKLKYFSAVVNQIEDISVLAELAALEELNLDSNKVSDISALDKLEKLSWVTLDNNKVKSDAVKKLKAKVELVYGDLQAGAFRAPGNQDKPRAQVSGPRPQGELALRVDADGSLGLDFVTTKGQRIETAQEWWGQLSREGQTLWLSQGERRLAIGELDKGLAKLCQGAFAKNCSFALGIKMPNDGQRSEPSVSVNLELSPEQSAQQRFVVSEPFAKHESLLPYVYSAPNQYDAGSCAYMSATGTMEILLNQKDKISKLDYASKNNLAEPFLMNLSGNAIPYFFTDSLYQFNATKAALPDKFMPFSLNAKGSAQKNWSAKIPSDWKSNATPLPKVERTVLFYDPLRDKNAKWNVALMDDRIVQRIKRVLWQTDAPVMVVYNHNGYWHVSIIVGYDDTHEHGECPMVKAGMKALTKQKKSGLVKRIEAHMKKLGGCTKKGAFLVRDSIYPGTAQDEPYTYGGAKSNGRYSRRIVKREYEWIWYLSNHVTSVYRAERGPDSPE